MTSFPPVDVSETRILGESCKVAQQSDMLSQGIHYLAATPNMP